MCRFCRFYVCVSLLSLLSTRCTSHSVPPVVATTHPLEWTGDRQAHTNRVLPSESKWWTAKHVEAGQFAPPSAHSSRATEAMDCQSHSLRMSRGSRSSYQKNPGVASSTSMMATPTAWCSVGATPWRWRDGLENHLTARVQSTSSQWCHAKGRRHPLLEERWPITSTPR